MAKVIKKKTKLKRLSTKEELELSDKSELIDQILRLEAYNAQLQTILRKNETKQMEQTKCFNGTKKQFDFTK